MKKNFTFTMQHDDINTDNKQLNFIVERLEPWEQFNLIIKIISIVANGHMTQSPMVEQILHNFFQTGVVVSDANKEEVGKKAFAVLIEAIKGALGSLLDSDRDFLISELLKNVKIDRGNKYIVQATKEELNGWFTSFKPIFKLIAQLVKINFGFLD